MYTRCVSIPPPLLLEGRHPKYRLSQPNRSCHYRDITVTVASLQGRLLHRAGALLNSLRQLISEPQFSFSRSLDQAVYYTFHARGNHSLRWLLWLRMKENQIIIPNARPIIRASYYPVISFLFRQYSVILDIIRKWLRASRISWYCASLISTWLQLDLKANSSNAAVTLGCK